MRPAAQPGRSWARRSALGVGGVALLWALGVAAALPPTEDPAYPEAESPSVSQQLDEIDRSLQISDGLPNEKARLYGLRAYLKGNYRAAASSFRKAARYADKYSQHRLSLMYWEGRGVQRDHAVAYVWSALAAERDIPNLLDIRKSMWASLDEPERLRARALVPEYFERYGDAVTKPRQIRAMKRFATIRTGSRAGFDGGRVSMLTTALGAGGHAIDISRSVSPKSFYNEERSDPRRYWRIQDALLAGGTVEVGDPVAGPEAAVPVAGSADTQEPNFQAAGKPQPAE